LENLAKKNAPFFPLMGGYQCDALQANGLVVLDAGFGVCEYHNLSGGIVALHKGIKT
jgi:hypothetical protein